jgi:hypothetical protein
MTKLYYLVIEQVVRSMSHSEVRYLAISASSLANFLLTYSAV